MFHTRTNHPSSNADELILICRSDDSSFQEYISFAVNAIFLRPLETTSTDPRQYYGFPKSSRRKSGGEAEYKKALELDPNDASAHQWYGQDIGWIGGREQEAMAEMNRAHQLDPLSSIITESMGLTQIAGRSFDDAISTCQKVASENPAFAQAHYCLAFAYWGKGVYAKAVEEYKILGELDGNPKDAEFASALEQGFHSGGWKGALSKGIEVRQAQRKASYWSAYDVAYLYAGLGEKDEAFRWLNAAYEDRDYQVESLKTDFRLDPVRSDPRLGELVRKVGLPQ